MLLKKGIENKEFFELIKLISNRQRFRMLELSINNQPTITELSSKLNLSYNKCAEYSKLLEKAKVIEKIKDGKNVRIKAKVKFLRNSIIFNNLNA